MEYGWDHLGTEVQEGMAGAGEGTGMGCWHSRCTATCSSLVHPDQDNEGQTEPRGRVKLLPGWDIKSRNGAITHQDKDGKGCE